MGMSDELFFIFFRLLRALAGIRVAWFVEIRRLVDHKISSLQLKIYWWYTTHGDATVKMLHDREIDMWDEIFFIFFETSKLLRVSEYFGSSRFEVCEPLWLPICI